MLDRLGSAFIMSAEDDAAEIIRRRLFEWKGVPADWASVHAGQLDIADPSVILDQFNKSYPFHPSVLSVFERKWQSLPSFQKTRGILRLLALWVSKAYAAGWQGAHNDQLITLGTAPLDDPVFRTAMLEQLGNPNLEGPVTTDVAGRNDSHAIRLDRTSRNEIRKLRLHRKTATSILFESNGGQTRDEATLSELRLAVGEPKMDIALVEEALETLSSTCFYLTVDRNRYRFSTKKNPNMLLAHEKSIIADPDINERVAKTIQNVFNEGGDPNLKRFYFPNSSNEVRNQPVLSLVVLRLDQPFQEPSTRTAVESMTQEHGSSERTFKSALDLPPQN